MNLKGVSSLKLHRDLKVAQKIAWFMLHRLREAWSEAGLEGFAGPVGKTAAAGVKDRETGKVNAQVIEDIRARTFQGFVERNTVDTNRSSIRSVSTSAR